MLGRKPHAGLAAVLALTLGDTCARNPVSGRPEVTLVSEAKERELGEAEARRVAEKMGILVTNEMAGCSPEGFDSPRLHFSQLTGIPIARRIAFSISTIRPGAKFPPIGLDAKRSRRRVVICSHFAIDGRSRPPSRARSFTCVGASRSTLETGTTMTSLARRLRLSGETTSAGRRLPPGSSGMWTQYR